MAVCTNSCPGSTYQDTASRQCLPCDLACLTCFGPLVSQCTRCVTGKYFDQDIFTCKSACPSNKYALPFVGGATDYIC